MCDLCRLVEAAKSPNESEAKVHYQDGLCVIIDSLGDKPTKDGFTRKVCIYRQHQIEPIQALKDAIIATAKRVFPNRVLWFPQTEDHTETSKRRPLTTLAAHWYFIIE